MPGPLPWWQVLNPAIYLVSVLPGVAVAVLAGGAQARSAQLAAATVGVVLLQHAINLFNDAKDWQLGADTEKQDSWVRFHGNRPETANRHAVISFLLGAAVGLWSLLDGYLWVLLYAAPFVILGLFYNFGRRPLSYTSAGEWATGLCYGPGVFGGLWFVAGQPLNAVGVSGMAAFAALSMALLFSHQPPQIETDRAAGKHSFAVRHGEQLTYRAASALFILAFVLLVVAVWVRVGVSFVALAFTAAATAAAWRIGRSRPNPRRILIHASLVFVALVAVALISRPFMGTASG